MAFSKLTWQSYDRIQQQHSPDWYWAVGIIALSITVTAVILNNILFAILVVISTVVLFLYTIQHPRLVTYELTNRGLWTNKEFQSFSFFESFCVTDEDPAKLIIKSKGLITPLLIIQLEAIDSQTVREFLQNYLPEAELREPVSKRIMEFLGF